MNRLGPIAVAGVLLALCGLTRLGAQAVSKRVADVKVTEPRGRTVAGLTQEQFAVMEGGVPRAITAFSEVREGAPQAGVHYRIEFESGETDASFQILLSAPPGVPELKLTWQSSQ